MKIKIYVLTCLMLLTSLCFAQDELVKENLKVDQQIPQDSAPVQGVTEDYARVVTAMIEKGDAALVAYSPSETVLTGNAFSRIYFDIFEGSGMEFTLNLKDSDLMLKIESNFSLIISQSMRAEPKVEIEKTWNALTKDLNIAVEKYAADGEGLGFWGRVIQSFLILFREGIEAMLVVAALVAYLRRSGYADKVKVIWWGCALALIASVIAAWLLNVIIKASGASREMMEGATMLLAAVVLIYVSYWLTAKSSADRWQAFIKGKMDEALSQGSLFTLGFVAFLAVFREGAETILFYQALMSGADGVYNAIWTGMGLAVVALIVVYAVIRMASIKLPIRLFFGGTAIFLFAMAFVFAGKGILELQVAGALHTTKLESWPLISWLGIFPTRESVIAQAIVLSFIPAGWLWLKTRKPQIEDKSEVVA